MNKAVEKTLTGYLCTFLVVSTLAVYWQVAGFEFTNFDDASHVAGNPIVQRGLTLQGVV